MTNSDIDILSIRHLAHHSFLHYLVGVCIFCSASLSTVSFPVYKYSAETTDPLQNLYTFQSIHTPQSTHTEIILRDA